MSSYAQSIFIYDKNIIIFPIFKVHLLLKQSYYYEFITMNFLINLFIFYFLETFFTDFEKCDWYAAFFDNCVSDERNKQIN